MLAQSSGGEPLTWTETGAGPAGETGTNPADPAAWGDVVLARKDVPASYHLCVVVDDAIRASPMWCAGRTCSTRPACIACCRFCSACRRRSTIIIG